MEQKEHNEFRDKIATVDKDGKRIWVYPKMPKGRFYDYRKYVSYVLLLVLFTLPFIKINGNPFVLFNVIKGEFYLFGVYFAPQDFHLFVIAMIIGVLFIALFTVIYGRLFCGWVCPQTIFMEMVFRRIEYWIEGDANAQKRLDKAPWTRDKLVKKGLKHLIFLAIAAVISHLFLSYIIGVEEVAKLVTEPIPQHVGGFVAMVVFTLTFYGVFAKLREQVCTTICPYGRMQGVLLDEDSLTVAYDFVRGEPRGKLTRQKANLDTPALSLSLDNTIAKGDCVDCSLCVQVCPTGIDIRNGTQLECVNCTACMDACDEVMIKIDKDPGLIRIDSVNNILHKQHKFWTARSIGYSVVLGVLILLESFLLFSRSDVETLILRTPGKLYQVTDDGMISNLYNYQIVNKTSKELQVTFDVEGITSEEIQYVGSPPVTIPNGQTKGALFIKMQKGDLNGLKNKLTILVYGDGKLIDKTKTTFMGPAK